MIFLTVGTVLPFDRLVRAMDAWAADHPQDKVIAQIGDGEFIPAHMDHFRMKGGPEYLKLLQDAEVIVAHAGMGSVISAQEYGVPIVLVPRLQALREHTTDHQLHTAEWLKTKTGVFVANPETELPGRISKAREFGHFQANLNHFAPESFLNRLRDFISDRPGTGGSDAT